MDFLSLIDLSRTILSLLRPAPTRPDYQTRPISASLLRELLPVSQFSASDDRPENCAVCLHEIADMDEIRRLPICQHMFHRTCLDRWMDHDHATCPLCRTQFVADDDLPHVFNEGLWLATGIFDFCGEY